MQLPLTTLIIVQKKFNVKCFFGELLNFFCNFLKNRVIIIPKGVEKMNRLKELRQERKKTQEQLADEVGVTKRTYIYWEKGERQIKPDKAQKLANYFEVPLWYLLGYDIADAFSKLTKKLEDIGITNYEDLEKLSGASDIIKEYINDEERFNLLVSTINPSEYSLLLRDLIKISELQNTKDADILLNYLLLEEHDKKIIFELITSLADKSIKSAIANKEKQDKT